MTYIFVENSPCFNVAGSPDPDDLSYCQCCDNSREYSAAINTCPESDLSFIGLPKFMNHTTALSPWNKEFNCSPILNSDQCASTFGFRLGAGTTFYDPVSPPAGVPGTKPLSDIGTLTTFPAPQTYTLTISQAGYTSTITMVPSNAKSAATATAAGGSGQAKGGSSSSLPSSSGSSSSSTSAGHRENGRLHVVGLLVGLIAFAFL
ncbi:hypothetical protein H2198_000777 [Neophaeococcomyces mojaviensis]|uniref:Uncharacterized protein n=1 Tax=Neophaeococcomyces mojaviensis TaxID=3383035 RepID=A0ACC3AJC7_9EURO|nr:hypothetical protein H2198_000777 [Knufia sp. JES_112]